MKKFLAFVPAVALLAMSAACHVLEPVSPVTSSMSQTVVLEDPDTNQAFCSGVWVAEKWVLTANHCTEDVSKDGMLPIRDFGGVTAQGEITFHDKPHDLALIHVAEPPQHPVAVLAFENPPVGAPVHVMGHPSGMPWTYTVGIVSGYRAIADMPEGLKNELEEEHSLGPWTQVSAPIWFGNSGGGVFDQYNHLLGITSFKTRAENTGFIVGLETVRSLVKAHTS